MKRIVIISDSLALPRTKPEVTLLEDTYPYLLKKHFEVYQCSIGGGLIRDLAEQAHYYNQYQPDIVILQTGIVDCAPRAYTYREETLFKLFKAFKLIRRLLSRTITTRRLRSIRKKVWTKRDDYRASLIHIIDKFPDAECYALSILPASEDYESLVPGITRNISDYNSILKSIFKNRYINIDDIDSDGIMSDYHHLSKRGHEYVYNAIMKAVK